MNAELQRIAKRDEKAFLSDQCKEIEENDRIGKSWRRHWHPNPVLLPGESHGQRSLVGCSPWHRTESDTTEATWRRQQQRSLQKIRDTKGTFHAKIGTIKERNSLDLTEAEDIKKKWQE